MSSLMEKIENAHSIQARKTIFTAIEKISYEEFCELANNLVVMRKLTLTHNLCHPLLQRGKTRLFEYFVRYAKENQSSLLRFCRADQLAYRRYWKRDLKSLGFVGNMDGVSVGR